MPPLQAVCLQESCRQISATLAYLQESCRQASVAEMPADNLAQLRFACRRAGVAEICLHASWRSWDLPAGILQAKCLQRRHPREGLK